MNIDIVRKIDRNMGIPLCFLLSIFKKLKNLFIRRERSDKPRKILFIEMSEMGSMVLAYSLFKKTEDLFPDAELHFLTFQKNRYAIDILGIIPEENVINIDDQNFLRFTFTTLMALRTIHKKKITTVIDMEFFARYTSLLAFLSGAHEIIGFYQHKGEGLYRGNLLTHRVIYNPQIHTAYNLLNLIYALASSIKDVPLPKRRLDPEDLIIPRYADMTQESRINLLKKLSHQNRNIAQAKTIILFNPNAGDIIPLRRWPVENYIQLGRKLLEHPGAFIIVTGLESEQPTGDKICRALSRERCINFSGLTSFSELIGLYHIADALITNDSGPAHFSAMTDIQTFVFFGPETPKLYGPLGANSQIFYANFSCSPCVSVYNHRQSPCQDNQCLKSISVQDVYEEIKKKLWG